MQKYLIEMRRYRRGLSDLLLTAIACVVGVILLLRGSAYHMVFAPFLPTVAYYFFVAFSELLGVESLLFFGIFSAIAIAAVWFVLHRYASKSRIAMVVATAFYAVDLSVLGLFSLLSGYAFGLLDCVFRAFILVTLCRASASAFRLAKMPPPDTGDIEGMMQNLVPVPRNAAYGDLLGDLPADEEDSVPLRDAVPRKRIFFDTTCYGKQVTVVRSRGLTELCIDGKVYAEVRGLIEFSYVLTASISGHRITVRFFTGGFRATMILLVDGYLVDKIHRYI